MKTSRQHPFLRPRRLNSYKAYAIGCAIAWAIVWAIWAATNPKNAIDKLLLFFLGWLVGWTSATIARVVYPPPKKRASAAPTTLTR
jgi:flagellar biosynthesis protein FliR